jgi:hypothetical protein
MWHWKTNDSEPNGSNHFPNFIFCENDRECDFDFLLSFQNKF